MARKAKKCILILAVIIIWASLFGACTVVKIGEDAGDGGDQYATWTKTGTGFNAVQYVASIWDEKLIPDYESTAVDFVTVMNGLRADRAAATKQYGLVRDSGEPAATFKVRGCAVVLEFDDTSRNGLFRVDLPPFDGKEDVTMQVGPVIRGTAIRDSLEFVRFTDIGNQIQFAALANELNARMMRDSVEPLDMNAIVGTQIQFLGAFKLLEGESLDDVVITPVRITPVSATENP